MFFIFSLSLINTTFAKNRANSYSNALEIKCENLFIIFCNFSSNIPFLSTWRSFGGALFASLKRISIYNSCFIKNENNAGGALYFKEHDKYTVLTGLFENIMAIQNRAVDGGFLNLSPGILEFNISIKSSFFDTNHATDCIIKSLFF